MGGGPSRGSSDESASSLEDPSRDGVLVVRMNRGGRYNSYPDYRAQSYGYGTGGAGYNPNVSSRRTSQQSGGNYQSGSAAHRNGETNRAVQGHSGGAGDSHRGPAHVAGHVAPAQGTGAAGRDSEGWGSALEGAGQQITALNGHVGSMFQSIENALEKLQEAREEMLTSRAAAAARKAAADELLADYTTRLGEARARVAELEDALTGRARAHGAQAATGFSFSEFTPADLAAAVNQVTQATSLFCARLGAALRSTLGPGYFMESGRDSGAARVACERDGKHLLTSLVTGALFLDFENESFTRGGPSCFPDSEERRAVQELEKRQIRAGSIDLDNVSSDPFRKYTVARLEAFAEALAKQFNIAPEKVSQKFRKYSFLRETCNHLANSEPA